MIEVTFDQPDDFLKIRETLTRIGLPSRDRSTLTQTCHLLHKKGRYYIVMFKELYQLDGQNIELSDEDIGRRNAIAGALEDWGLCSIIDPARETLRLLVGRNAFTVIPFRDKSEWNLKSNYTFNKKGRGHAQYGAGNTQKIETKSHSKGADKKE